MIWPCTLHAFKLQEKLELAKLDGNLVEQNYLNTFGVYQPNKMTRSRLLILFSVFLISNKIISQNIKLSTNAVITVITAGPGQAELFTAFGHSAFRVFDPENGIDWVYNYGTFDFDQPNFYLNFAKGHLNYKLSRYHYQQFKTTYIYYNRSLYEQVLNINQVQKQKLFDFLENNNLPENQYYMYDYFYDNCSSRIRDALISVFGDDLTFDHSYLKVDYNFRELVDIYNKEQPWGNLGIDLCLGLPMDKKLEPDQYMFLPDYIFEAFSHASLKNDSATAPLVKRTITTYESLPAPSMASKITPVIAFWAFFILMAIITFFGWRKNVYKKGIDIGLFSLMGIFGWLFFLLWVATDHASAYNHNLLWAVPLHFPIALLLVKRRPPNWVKKYFQVIGILMLIILLLWYVWPQQLHHSLIPIILALSLRSWQVARNIYPAKNL